MLTKICTTRVRSISNHNNRSHNNQNHNNVNHNNTNDDNTTTAPYKKMEKFLIGLEFWMPNFAIWLVK